MLNNDISTFSKGCNDISTLNRISNDVFAPNLL